MDEAVKSLPIRRPGQSGTRACPGFPGQAGEWRRRDFHAFSESIHFRGSVIWSMSFHAKRPIAVERFQWRGRKSGKRRSHGNHSESRR